jgi:calcineurin-like phosphoesterase
MAEREREITYFPAHTGLIRADPTILNQNFHTNFAELAETMHVQCCQRGTQYCTAGNNIWDVSCCKSFIVDKEYDSCPQS